MKQNIQLEVKNIFTFCKNIFTFCKIIFSHKSPTRMIDDALDANPPVSFLK